MAKGKAFSSAVIASVLLFALALFGAGFFNNYISKPGKGNGNFVVIDIPKGQGFAAIAKNLQKSGILKHPALFRVYAKLSGRDVMIKAGRYRFSGGQAPSEILDDLVSGRGRLNKLTVIEGWTIYDIAKAAEEAGFARASDILALALDPIFVKSLGLNCQSLEGYLFPDSYFLPYALSDEKAKGNDENSAVFLKNAARSILVTMVGRFKEKFSDKLKERARIIGLSVHQIVILASVIEKETGAANEYPLIASVFYNRLKEGMRLQSDPTVIYGLKDFNGNLTKIDLRTDHPYNTYTRRGLPEGPISNPGYGAIMGALYPARTDYLYFVAKGDGTHQFSETLGEHNLAVAKYQLKTE